MTFEEKVRSLSAKEMILVMVDALRNPSTDVVDMRTYGCADGQGICFGCAATNTIAKIAGVRFTSGNINNPRGRAIAVKSKPGFLCAFESAINNLRLGKVAAYNDFAAYLGIARIKKPDDLYLPILTSNNYRENLWAYERLAEMQEEN